MRQARMEKTAAGKTLWITGAGSGIGRATALELAAGMAGSGARLALSGRRQEALAAVRREVLDLGADCEIFPLDVADQQAVQAVAAQIRERLGTVSVLVGCAGANIERRRLEQLTPQAWDGVININLNGALYPMLSVLEGMRAQGDGLFVTISSWVGRYPAAVTGAAYAASKRALIALSESINLEENAHGIRSCVICPAAVATEIMDKRPQPPSASERAAMLQAQDVARMIAFIAAYPTRVCVNEIVLSPTKCPV